MNPSAKLSELIDALEFESEESVTRFDRQTGRIVSVDRHILSVVGANCRRSNRRGEWSQLSPKQPAW
jgi:hypothetical protein